MLVGIASMSARHLPVAAEWRLQPPVVAASPKRGAREVPAARYRPSAAQWLELPAEFPSVIHRAKIAPQFGLGRFSGFRVPEGEAHETGGWIALREPQRIDSAYLALCSDIWRPASLEPFDQLTHAPTIEFALHLRAELPADGLSDQPILAYFRANAAAEGLVDEDGALFLSDGTLLAQSRQLALLVPPNSRQCQKAPSSTATGVP